MPNGYLSADELMQLWQSVVDPGYASPLISAGEGEGLDAEAALRRVTLSHAKALWKIEPRPNGNKRSR